MKTLLTSLLVILYSSLTYSQYAELPVFDDFSNDYANWTTYSVIGDDQWHLSGDDGIDGGKCARFYITSNPPQANDDWLVSHGFNTAGISNIAIEFKFWHHGDGMKPQFYYTNNFTGNISTTDWIELDNSFWKNEWIWNDARIEIENPGNTFFFAVRFQSTTENSEYVLIDNFNIESYEPVIFEKVGTSEHFEFYTNIQNQTNYWQEIDESLESSYQKYCGIWNYNGKSDFMDNDIKTKVYYQVKSEITLVNEETPEKKSGFIDQESQSIFLSPLNTTEKQAYYGNLEGLAKNTFAILAKKFQLIRDRGGEDWLPLYFEEGFGLYEQGYRPIQDSIRAYKNQHQKEYTHADLDEMNIFGGTSEKDMIVSYVEGQIVCTFDYNGVAPYGSYVPIWNNFLTYFYDTTEVVQIKKYASNEHFDIYCSARDTMHIDSFFVWLERPRQFYIDSFQMLVNRKYNLVILYDEQTGMDLTGYGDWNGGTGGLNISPQNYPDYRGGGYRWLLAHEFGHVYNSLMAYDMPIGFYHEGMANFSGFILYDVEWEMNRIFTENVLYYFLKNFNREPTLNEFITNPYEKEGGNIYPYYFGLEFIRYLYETEGLLKIKEFFNKGMDFSVFSQTYNEIEAGYIKRLKMYNNLICTDTLVEIPFNEPFNDFSNGWTKPSLLNPENWQINDGGINETNCAGYYTYSNKHEPVDCWLVSPAFNTKEINQVQLSFDFSRFGNGIELEVLSTDKFEGNTDSTNWTLVKSVDMPTDWGWSNTGEIKIQNPPDSLFIGLRMKSTGEQHQQLYFDNFEIKSYESVVYEKVGSTEHFEFYTDNSENKGYWLLIKDNLEEQFNKYQNYWNSPGAPDYIEQNTKTKIYLSDRENIKLISDDTPDWKMGFYTCDSNSIYLDNSISQLPETNQIYQYYNGISGLTIHTFAGYALQLILNRDANGLQLPEFVAEGFGLYERGYRPNHDSIISFKEVHPEFVDDAVMARFTDYINTSEKDIVTAFVEYDILFHGAYRHCNYWYYDWIGEEWEKFLYYFYTTPDDTEQIKKYDECEYFEFYCSSQDTVFIDSMKVWLNQTRNYYVDSFEMELNIQIPIVIVNQKTGAELTGSPGFNGGSGNINISPHDVLGGFESYNWLLGHEVGHVFNDFMCFAEPYYAMPFGFYHEGMANFSGFNVAGDEHRDDLWKIPCVFDYYQQEYNREPTLEEFINDPDERIDCYFFGFEFIRYLRKTEGYLKIKEFFINKMDFSIFSVSYEDLEQGYIDYLKSLIDQNYPELITNSGIFIERGSSAVITTENLSASDQEAADDGLFFEIVTNPTNGHLAKISDPDTPITKFSEQNIKQERVIYINDNTSASSDFFRFTVTDEALTAGVFQFNITLTNPTAISEFENARKNQLKIYPNPITNKSVISFQTKTSGKVNISIYDMQGRKICTLLYKKLSAGTQTVPVSISLPASGVYFCKLQTPDGISTKKLIVNSK